MDASSRYSCREEFMLPIEESEICIPSDTSEGQAVQQQIVGRLQELDFSVRDVFAVQLALEEAITNAIKHGNQGNPKKQVRIAWRIDSDRIRVEIEDEGAGFDPKHLPDPTTEENLEKPSGRGVMLIREFMSLLEFNERGNMMVMEKERTQE